MAGMKRVLPEAAAMERRRRAAEEAARLASRSQEQFTPTSRSERDLAARAFLEKESAAGREVKLVDPQSGLPLAGMKAARRLMEVNEARRMAHFSQRTGLDPTAQENRAMPRDQAMKLVEESQQTRAAFTKKVRDPFKTGRILKQARTATMFDTPNKRALNPAEGRKTLLGLPDTMGPRRPRMV